jgi:hypothetical protein
MSGGCRFCSHQGSVFVCVCEVRRVFFFVVVSFLFLRCFAFQLLFGDRRDVENWCLV